MDASDVIAVHDLMARYGHVIDDRDWGRIGELFTDDVVYDCSDMGIGVFHGIAEVLALWSAPTTPHPLAHHVTNVVVTEDADGTVRVRSYVAGPVRSGKVLSFSYRDVVERGADGGWRMRERIITLRRAEPRPQGG